MTALAGTLYWQGKWPDAMGPYTDALALYREFGDESDVAEALYNLSFTYAFTEDFDKAEELLQESLGLSERLGDRIGIGRAYWGLGNMVSFRSDWDALTDYMHRATTEFEALDRPFDLGWSYFMNGYGFALSGETTDARRYLLKAMDIFAAVLDVSALTLILEMYALVLVKEGDGLRAAQLAGAAHRLKADTGVGIGDVSFNQYPELNEFLNAADEKTEEAYQEGHRLSVEDAIALAREA